MRVRLTLFLLLFGAAGCIEDPTALEGPPLSDEELQLLGFEISATTLEARLEAGLSEDAPGGAGSAATPGGAAAAPVVVDLEATRVRPCVLGGDVDITAQATGSYDDVTRVGTITFDIVAEPDDCRRQRGARTFTLNGWPNLIAGLDFTRDAAGILSLDGTIDGGVLFERDDHDGTGICLVDLALEGSVDRTESNVLPVRVTGTLCGAAVDATTTYVL